MSQISASPSLSANTYPSLGHCYVMADAQNTQIVTLTHLWAAIQYWWSCLVRVIFYECKALLEILVNGQADRLQGLR